MTSGQVRSACLPSLLGPQALDTSNLLWSVQMPFFAVQEMLSLTDVGQGVLSCVVSCLSRKLIES